MLADMLQQHWLGIGDNYFLRQLLFQILAEL